MFFEIGARRCSHHKLFARFVVSAFCYEMAVDVNFSRDRNYVTYTGEGEAENWILSVYHARSRCAVAVALSRFFVPFLAYQ